MKGTRGQPGSGALPTVVPLIGLTSHLFHPNVIRDSFPTFILEKINSDLVRQNCCRLCNILSTLVDNVLVWSITIFGVNILVGVEDESRWSLSRMLHPRVVKETYPVT